MLLLVTAVSVVLIVSFLCSVSESVLLSVTPAQVETLAQKHRRAGRLLADYKRNIDRPIAAILILNTAAHTIGAAVSGASYSLLYGTQTLWIFTIAFTIAVLLFTEIIPKTLGVTYTAVLARPAAFGIRVMTFVLRPLVVVSEQISRALRGEHTAPVTSVEEIRLLAALGRTEGAVGVRTASMIVGATHLRQLTASDVMLPRQQVVYLSQDMSVEQVLVTARNSGHSRFPFAPENDVDQLSGVVIIKELLYWLQDNPGVAIDWPPLVHEPIVVPESMSLLALLRTFQDARQHMAIVVDEYGDVEGIVTLEDVLEEIVGEILDESDRPVENIWPQSDGSLHVRATVDLRKVCSKLDLPWQPEDEVTTVGGLVTELLGRLPVRGDAVEWNGCRLEILAASERRAELIAVTRLPFTEIDGQ
jgi:CBS domain containing-hemolysin-like protein